MNKILEVQHIEKSYRENKAVNDLSFHVNEGEILGLLGPNGAGKSTTISILSTILKNDAGKINIFNLPLESHINEIKGQLGIVPQEIAIYEDISAYRNVAFFASLYGLKKNQLEERVMNALAFVGLEDKKNDAPKTFSGGMKRRLNIACSVVHSPEILIMDEPTVGIDPQSRNHIMHLIRTLQERGTTVIYISHYIEEIEELCNRVIIMDYGKLLVDDEKDIIKKRYYDKGCENLESIFLTLTGTDLRDGVE